MTEPEPTATEPTASSETTAEPEATVAEEPAATEPDTTDETATAAEDASDAELRAWARDNGIEGVPASGKLSAAWREQITAAMAAALDPKVEDSADSTSSESPTPETTEDEPAEEPVAEYRSVFEPPNTWVTSQTYTA